MKTIAFSILVLIAVFKSQAQNYQINFKGTGASTSIDSVKVENLSQCTSLTFAGSDTLNLTPIVGINGELHPGEYQMKIYPNPSPGNCAVEFEAASTGNAGILLYDMTGKMVLKKTVSFQEGPQGFVLNGIQAGIYYLEIESNEFRYTAKLTSTASFPAQQLVINTGPPGAAKKGHYSNEPTTLKNFLKNKSLINMIFNAGDTLKLTGTSGNYRTVGMLFPNQSQVVTFNFVPCTDADSNHYTVVQIGSQLWMQENLKTTKYRDGSDIPNVTDSAAWGNLSTGAWCDYHNLPSEGEYYGHLYNFYAISDTRNMCPPGWHVASNHEWNILEKFLDPAVDTTALGGRGTEIGRILKEGCVTRWAYMDSTYGINSAGFTALCTNYRTATGAWSLAPDNNHDCSFWTATSYNANSAWYRSLRWCYGDIYSLFPFKRGGCSVRCIRDN
ncbi:MAG: FISUMP domain-containing protein [Bacteroidota bacterium]